MITALIVAVCVILFFALIAAASAIRVLREYERAVLFRLGRLMDVRGPGLVMLVPTIDRMVRVSLRTVTLTIPPQEVITRDNIPVRVTAVAYYRVVDANSAITQVENFHSATLQIAQTTLRSVLGGADLDSLLSDRERLNEALQQIIDDHTEPWGIKVSTVEIKDVEIPDRMQHAIARQAEAERERRAKIINAEGEFQAAAKLAQAADVIGQNPVTLQLRYLQTLREIGGDQNSTVVFPMPIDLVGSVIDAIRGGASANVAPPPLASGAPAQPAREALDAPAREALDAPAREALDAPARETLDAPAREALDAPAREALDAPTSEAVGNGDAPPSALQAGDAAEPNGAPRPGKRAGAPRPGARRRH